jgi:hypothetical protein
MRGKNNCNKRARMNIWRILKTYRVIIIKNSKFNKDKGIMMMR